MDLQMQHKFRCVNLISRSWGTWKTKRITLPDLEQNIRVSSILEVPGYGRGASPFVALCFRATATEALPPIPHVQVEPQSPPASLTCSPPRAWALQRRMGSFEAFWWHAHHVWAQTSPCAISLASGGMTTTTHSHRLETPRGSVAISWRSGASSSPSKASTQEYSRWNPWSPGSRASLGLTQCFPCLLRSWSSVEVEFGEALWTSHRWQCSCAVWGRHYDWSRRRGWGGAVQIESVASWEMWRSLWGEGGRAVLAPAHSSGVRPSSFCPTCILGFRGYICNATKQRFSYEQTNQASPE